MQARAAINPAQRDSVTNRFCTDLKRESQSFSALTTGVAVCWQAALAVLLSIAAIQVNAADEPSMPEIDTATTQRSENGRYDVSFQSIAGPIEINIIHEWLLTVLTTDGTPVDDLTISIEGGMPMHDHGLPTAPRVTESLGRGEYRVEGFKFQMHGHWTTTFNFTDSANSSDSVTFNFLL